MTRNADTFTNTQSQARSYKWPAYLKQHWPLYVMMLPALILLILFSFLPMYGVVIAFQKFNPLLGFTHSPWVGLKNFENFFAAPNAWQIIANTLIIAVGKIVSVQIVAIMLAVMLNEVRLVFFRRAIQNMIYLPYFISWVVLAGIFIDMFSSIGLFNSLLKGAGLEPVQFLASNTWFRPVLILTNLWQQAGWATIIYLAALLGVNPTLIEAAALDGCNRIQRIWYIHLPSILPTIIVLGCLSLGSILNAGFDQVLNLYNPVVYPTGDILDTFVYRAGLISAQYGFAGAVGLVKSAVGVGLIIVSWQLAKRFAGYSIF